MINSNFGFTPLQEVWLGNCYPESFYNHLPNEIADSFSYITELTNADTGALAEFLEQRGIVVRRPVFDNVDKFLDEQDRLIKPPVVPRDNFLALDKTLYAIGNYQGWEHCMLENTVIVSGGEPMKTINPPSIVRCGQDLYVDIDTHTPDWARVCEWMVEQAKHYRVNVCNTNGHSDAVFSIIRPGIIVTSAYKTDYSQSFPDWEVFRIIDFLPRRPISNTGNPYAWHVPHMQPSSEFTNYIGSQAVNWVGNYLETVLDVNMLVLNENNVVLMKENTSLIRWLETIGVTAHVFPLRTWSFWDGGWSCFTLDVHRDDTKQDLFPERGSNGVYWRLK